MELFGGRRATRAAAICGGIVLALAVCAATAAAEATNTIAAVQAETPISAGGGWLVWSVPAAGGWALDAYHDGVVARLPVASRPQPFDASVGTDARGAPVVTYSRCKRTPEMWDVGITQAVGGVLLQPHTGTGCSVRVLELDGGRERALAIPRSRGSSDTTPSMWHGEVSFARKAPGHGPVWQVMSWSSRSPGHVLTLGHGAIPIRCSSRPCKQPAHGEVQALDRDGQIVTFLWHLEGEGVVGEGAWELRVDRLAGGRSRLAEAGFEHEACIAPRGPGELESIWPEAPIAAGRSVLFSELEDFDCFTGFGATLGSYALGAAHARSGDLAKTVLWLAKDGSTLYGLVPGPAPAGADSPSCTPTEPCAIERIAEPAMKAQRFVPTSPFTG